MNFCDNYQQLWIFVTFVKNCDNFDNIASRGLSLTSCQSCLLQWKQNQLSFIFSGLTIDSTAANLVPSDQVAQVPHSLVHLTRRKRQLLSSENRKIGELLLKYFKNMRRATDRNKKSISILPKTTSQKIIRTRPERQVINILPELHSRSKVIIPDTEKCATKFHHQQPKETTDQHFGGNLCRGCNGPRASSPRNYHQRSQDHTHSRWSLRRIPRGTITD